MACSDDEETPDITGPGTSSTTPTGGGGTGTETSTTSTSGETSGTGTGTTTSTTGVDAGDDADSGDEPDVDEPDTDEPDVDEPDTDQPDVDEPDVDEPDVDEPDVDESDASDAGQDTQPDTDESDADESDADEPDADESDADPTDADIPDAPGDADNDDASEDVIPDGPPIEDGGGGGDDAGNNGPTFDRSCMYPLIECFALAQPASCTHNPDTGHTDLSFGAGLAQRNARSENGQYSIQVFNQGELCFRADANDALDQPLSYAFTSGDPDNADLFTVVNNGDTTTITCADGTEESWDNDAIEGFLPRVYSPDDEICVSNTTPRCVADDTCSNTDPTLECCAVADTTRCLTQNACPQIPPQDPEIDSCIGPMLSCFGAGYTLLACYIDPNDGITEADFTRDRRAAWIDEGQPSLFLETANLEDGTFCYSANLPKQGPLDEVSFFDFNTSEQHLVEIDGDTATVSCSDGSQETIPAIDVLAYIPPRPLPGNPFCEEVPLEECTTEAQCGGGESCCDTDEGRRCLPGLQCPEPDDRWQDSCLFGTFDCFGDERTLSVCTDYEGIDYTEVSYLDGASSIFSSQSNNPTFQASSPGGFLCFDSVRQIGTDRYEIYSNLEDASYVLELGESEALISCPGNVSQTVDTADVLPYLATRPDSALCDPPEPDHECDEDVDCNDPLLICCDGGDRRLCLGDCGDAQPRNLCQDDSECADGLSCCNQPSVRVCDAALCGDEVCCYLESAQVCETDRVCEQALECDPEDVNACDGGQRCCQGLTSDIFICRDEPQCGDFEAPTCTQTSDCQDLGPTWDCCPSEGPNRCQDTSENNGECVDLNGQDCTVDSDCEDGTICCASGGNVCIPALECDDPCRNDNDCGDGLVCCADTEQCSLAADCASAPQCQTNDDCGEGAVCCHAGSQPLCIAATDCPSACSNDADCPDGLRCCGSQDSPFGTYCADGSACEDVEPRACSVNADCPGDADVCCRTLDEPACISADACPEACDPANPCGDGEECCSTGVRTPICVAEGSCALDLGEPCSDGDTCGDGLTCCPYDDFGDVCVPAASCGQNIPPVSCENASNICQDFPLAVCCLVEGVAQCADEVECDLPSSFLCTGDEDCGTGGFRCCNEAVDSECVLWQNAGSCQADNTCTDNSDCPNSLVCCPSAGNICIQPERCDP